ncbi:hypothetical protein D3C76_70800 [compost metagenome]|uniref:DUF2232 domain-containing protein n=1 Tax=Paenibacillus rhizolycopersici TaxID=2780073 RepID=A0ABS2H6P4_9BACL|nr:MULTISPECIES: DUF2232 domain-containing protein [Paenibacillus]MBM6996481.1 DUF2232 domain-containing protein [Paenibacillus rhizolycopersici]MUG84774.1 DUF2232 domain-containing protein [Paenibacillus timonensis]GIP47966.1 membrane protein [Paenibacillus sp. J53TS2]
MKLRWTSVAWSAAYLLLLLSLATPLTVITMFFLIVPGILLYTTLSTRVFLVHVAVVWLAASLIFGPVILLQAVYFIIPSIVMGYLYKKRVPAFRTIMTGAGTILLEFLLVLLISTVFFDFNLATAIEDLVNSAMAPFTNVADSSLAGGIVWSPEMSQQFSSLTVRMIPFTMIVCSLLIAAVAHAISRPTLSSLGHAVPKLPPIRDWRLPRSLIWYYLIGVLLQWFGGEAVQQGFMGTILLNLMPLLQFLFMVQTASFFFFAAYHRKWNPVIPILLIVAMLFIPPLRIVGILDIAFPLRDMITRSRR